MFMKKRQILMIILLFLFAPQLYATVYEDGEDGEITGWTVFDNTPNGAAIYNVLDTDVNSMVIKLKGTKKKNAYMLGNKYGEAGDWNNSLEKNIKWSMKYSEPFRVIIMLNTQNGNRKLIYKPIDNNQGLSTNGKRIRYGLGQDAKDGSWRTFRRNLEDDLQQYDSGNSIISVNGFRIRGSGRVDDIELLTAPEVCSYLTNMGTCINLRKSSDALKLYLTHANHNEVEIASVSNDFGGKISATRFVPLEDGGYAVFWMEYSQMADEALKLDLFDHNGNNIINDKRLGIFNPGGTNPTINVLENGNYVVGWCKNTGSRGIKARLYSDIGTLIREISVFDGPFTCHQTITITSLDNGGFTVIYGADSATFDQDGNPI